MRVDVGRRAVQTEPLHAAYAAAFPRSHDLFRSGARYFPNGVSQYTRFYRPFPIFVESARGAELRTVDGRTLIDFWQGHFANLFGHAPEYLVSALDGAACRFQLGCNTAVEQEAAALLCEAMHAEQAIFCTTGAQATMLATLIGLAHTQRTRVVKIHGGWHGVQPWSLSGVKARPQGPPSVECGGIPAAVADDVVTVPFNDADRLRDLFTSSGDRIGVVVAELVLGNAGMEMATPAFVRCLRECCDRYGAILVFDELVTGFRCHGGPLSERYGVRPDLATVGKIVAGGMPFAAIIGARELFRTVRTEQAVRVLADVGTFTSHPGALAAVAATLQQIKAAGPGLYHTVDTLARSLRDGLRRALADHGIPAHVTGDSPDGVLPAFPIMTVRFLRDDTSGPALLWHWDPDAIDIELRDELSRVALCLRGVFPWQGGGVVTAAHTPEHVAAFTAAYRDWLSTWSD